MLLRVQVEHELADGALEPREALPQHDKARAGQLRAGLEVHLTERLAEDEMLLGVVQPRPAAPAAVFDVGVLVLADRHVGLRHVRDDGERIFQRLVGGLRLGLKVRHRVLQRGDLGHQLRRRRLVLLRLGVADFLRGRRCAAPALLPAS